MDGRRGSLRLGDPSFGAADRTGDTAGGRGGVAGGGGGPQGGRPLPVASVRTANGRGGSPRQGGDPPSGSQGRGGDPTELGTAGEAPPGLFQGQT